MKRILMTAYAVNPYKGSEDGMGWNFICQAARFNQVVVITRKNNAEAIRQFMRENPRDYYDRMEFLYFDLPVWIRFWKRGSRGALLYFYLWQLTVPGFIRKCRCRFDIAHNLNFHNDWTPSRLWTLGKPLVWGPIGHHPAIPQGYLLGTYGMRCYFDDLLRHFVKRLLWKTGPLLHSTIRHASVIIAMNRSVENVLPLRNKKVIILPSVGSEEPGERTDPKRPGFHVISIGRFTPLKGFDITINSFARFYHLLSSENKKKVTLTLIGSGPSENLLKELVKNSGISGVTTFLDWVDRPKLKEYYRQSTVFLFPSHEGAGMVVSEALSHGLPVVCFDNCGPGEFINEHCGIKIPYSRYKHSIRQFSGALKQLFENKILLESLSQGARARFHSHFEWNTKGEQLLKIYDSLPAERKTPAAKNKIVAVHLLNDYSGSPLVFAEALKGLVQSGHEIDLYTCGGSEGFLTGLPVRSHHFWYRFYQHPYARLIAFSVSQVLLFFRLFRYRNQPVDFYINTLLPFGAALAGKLMGKKVIYHLHETSINPPVFKKFLKMIGEATANTAIYVSHYLMKTEGLRGVYSSVVHNALPDEFVHKASSFRLHRPHAAGDFHVLMLCSLKTYKGIPDYVELAERMSHIHFDLVLNASEENINRYFSGKKLPANLSTHAATRNVHPFYEKASLVLNLSHPDQWVETFGMTILEAMCYGIPVIAPPIGGVTELVQPNINGFLKDVRSKHDMLNTINRIYADPILCKRLSEQALLTSEKFRLQHMQQQVCELICKPVGK